MLVNSKTKKRTTVLAAISAAMFAVIGVVGPAMGASGENTDTMALTIILPALALCSATILGIWHRTSKQSAKRATISERSR